jgi:hypothetical protein
MAAMASLSESLQPEARRPDPRFINDTLYLKQVHRSGVTVTEASALDHLVERLLRNGSALISPSHVLLQKQADLALFTALGAQLQDALGDEDFAINMASQEDGLLITLKVGDEADEAPDFSPPEPKSS